METKRQKKISRVILKELSNIFHKEMKQILGNILVTITLVRVSSDLSVAKIYLSVFPIDDPSIALDKINNNKNFFRNLLGKELKHQLRIIPELIFYIDDSAEYSEEIDRLLKN